MGVFLLEVWPPTSCGGSGSQLTKPGCFHAGDSWLMVENNFLETEGVRVCIKRPPLFERSCYLRTHPKHHLGRTSVSLVCSLVCHKFGCKRPLASGADMVCSRTYCVAGDPRALGVSHPQCRHWGRERQRCGAEGGP